MKGKVFTARDVKKIAQLAQIPLKPDEEQSLAQGFNTTMQVVDKLFSVVVSDVEPTSQVTGQENVYREDFVNTSRMLSRDQVFKNTLNTHNGYFVVNQILDK